RHEDARMTPEKADCLMQDGAGFAATNRRSAGSCGTISAAASCAGCVAAGRPPGRRVAVCAGAGVDVNAQSVGSMSALPSRRFVVVSLAAIAAGKGLGWPGQA